MKYTFIYECPNYLHTDLIDHTVTVTYDQPSIDELFDAFRGFLVAASWSPETINGYIQELGRSLEEEDSDFNKDSNFDEDEVTPVEDETEECSFCHKY